MYMYLEPDRILWGKYITLFVGKHIILCVGACVVDGLFIASPGLSQTD